jgi:hypothetical protein
MYGALQGHGCVTRLVILPYESHAYRAHESIMHVLYEKERWLEMYCPPGARKDELGSSISEVEAAAAIDSSKSADTAAPAAA